jgi:hypothetical protein
MTDGDHDISREVEVEGSLYTGIFTITQSK